MQAAPFCILILILHIQRFNQLHIGMFFLEILERKLIRKENQRTLEVIEYQHLPGIQDVFDGFDVVGVYPSCNAEIEAVHADSSIILVLKAVLEDFKLKLADRADYDFVVLVAVNLDRTFLRELIYAFWNCLAFIVSFGVTRQKSSGGKVGSGSKKSGSLVVVSVSPI